MSTVRINHCIECSSFPCEDVNHSQYLIPAVNVDQVNINVIIISECVPPDPRDHYYAGEEASFAESTLSVLQAAGFDVTRFSDLLAKGIYCTTAVKCGKTGYGIKASTIRNCSLILEKELALFSRVKAYMLMGDVAIKAVNHINQRLTGNNAIPKGATYKLRAGNYTFQGHPVFPSYLQVGPSFGIEKSKERMIVEDLQRVKRFLQE